MNDLASKDLNSFKYALEANYYVSLIVSIAAATLRFSENQNIFKSISGLYGPLSKNLKIMMVYIALAEFAMFLFCFLKRNDKELLTAAGLLLILLSGAFELYGRVNPLPIDQTYHLFFLYAGLSHIAYGSLSFLYPKSMSATHGSENLDNHALKIFAAGEPS